MRSFLLTLLMPVSDDRLLKGRESKRRELAVKLPKAWVSKQERYQGVTDGAMFHPVQEGGVTD